MDKKNLEIKIEKVKETYKYYLKEYREYSLVSGKKKKIAERHYRMARERLFDIIDFDFLYSVFPKEAENQGEIFYSELREELKKNHHVVQDAYEEIMNAAENILQMK